MAPGVRLSQSFIHQNLTADVWRSPGSLPMGPEVQQLSWADVPALLPAREEAMGCLTGQM